MRTRGWHPLSRNKRNGERLPESMVQALAGPDRPQGVSSAETSINNGKKLPRIYGIRWVQKEHIEGKDVVDLSAGKRPENVTSRFPNVVPRDPFNLPREVNIRALRGIYDTAIISNTLNVLDDDRAIYELLKLAKTVADTTLITVYESKEKGYTTRGYQRAVKLADYLPYAYRVFGRENVTIRGGVMVCEAWRRA